MVSPPRSLLPAPITRRSPTRPRHGLSLVENLMPRIDCNAHRKQWTTHDECILIRKLYERHGPLGLKNYIDSCQLRISWDLIDPAVALATARRLLDNHR